MHIADILSRLAGKDLEAPNVLIPISFNVMTRTKRTPTQQIKLFTVDKLKPSQLPPSYIPPNLSELQTHNKRLTDSKTFHKNHQHKAGLIQLFHH